MSTFQNPSPKLNEVVKNTEDSDSECSAFNINCSRTYMIANTKPECISKERKDDNIIRVVPILRLNLLENINQVSDEEVISTEEKKDEFDVKFAVPLDKSYLKEEDVKDNSSNIDIKFIGNKRKLVPCDILNKTQLDESTLQNNTFNININQGNNKDKRSHSINNNNGIRDEDLNRDQINIIKNISAKKKIRNSHKTPKLLKKRKTNKSLNVMENFHRYFKKFFDEVNYKKKTKHELIKEIMMNSQLLSETGLVDLSKYHHLRLCDNNTNIDESSLETKNMLTLERINVDITIISKLLKLGEPPIPTIKKLKRIKELTKSPNKKK